MTQQEISDRLDLLSERYMSLYNSNLRGSDASKLLWTIEELLHITVLAKKSGMSIGTINKTITKHGMSEVTEEEINNYTISDNYAQNRFARQLESELEEA